MLKWQDLKKISDTRLVKGMYFWVVFVPISAKFLALIESPLNAKLFDTTVRLQLSLPFSWTAFFFAAVSFSIARILFIAFAPKIISDHPSYSHFTEAGKTHAQLKNYASELNLNYAELELPRNLSGGGGALNHPDQFQQAYWFVVEKAEEIRSAIRLIISLFYAIGFILMVIVFIQSVIFVSSEILR